MQRLGRTAKEIAAEIGEELIAVKQKLAHGEFMPWVEANCIFSDRSAQDYMKIAKTKAQRAADFKSCDSIRDVLALGKPKPEPKPERRAATLKDLRRVDHLRNVRDDPGATAEGELLRQTQRLFQGLRGHHKLGPVPPVGGVPLAP